MQKAFLSDIRGRTATLASKIVPARSLIARKAIEVYQRGYALRLTDAISENYEALWYALGDKKFFDLCSQYRAAYPSKSYDLNSYGDKLVTFVKKRFPRRPYLYHLARFETLIFSVFNAAEDSAAEVDFSKLDAEKHVFDLQDGVRLFHSPYRIYELWRHRARLSEGYEPGNFKSAEFLLLYKRDHKQFFVVISKSQYAVVGSLLAGKTISQAILAVQKNLTISEEEVITLFSLIASPGIVKAVHRI